MESEEIQIKKSGYEYLIKICKNRIKQYRDEYEKIASCECALIVCNDIDIPQSHFELESELEKGESSGALKMKLEKEERYLEKIQKLYEEFSRKNRNPHESYVAAIKKNIF